MVLRDGGLHGGACAPAALRAAPDDTRMNNKLHFTISIVLLCLVLCLYH